MLDRQDPNLEPFDSLSLPVDQKPQTAGLLSLPKQSDAVLVFVDHTVGEDLGQRPLRQMAEEMVVSQETEEFRC